MTKRKSQNYQKKKSSPDLGIPHILTVDQGKGESLFLLVEFSRPGENYMRRVISKRLGDGRIHAATYHGPTGPDGMFTEKKDLMWMTATEEQFMKSLRYVELRITQLMQRV